MARRRRRADHRRPPRHRQGACSSNRAACATGRTDLLAEEDDLARALASTWARDPDKSFPRLHAEPDTLLDPRSGSFWTIDSTPESPDTPVVEATGWGPVVGDGSGLTDRLIDLLGRGSPRRRRRRRRRAPPSACTSCCSTTASTSRSSDARRPICPPRRPRRGRAAAPRCTMPERQGRHRRRERPHRPTPRPPQGPARRRGRAPATFEDLKPGNYVVHHQHGVGQYEGMVKRTIGGVERDYLLLAYKGGDKLYVPSDQIDTLRQYVGGEAPELHRLGGADFAKAKSRVRSAVREIAQELVVLYQKRVNAAGSRVRRRTRRGSTRWRRPSRSSRRPISARRSTTSRPTWSAPYPMDRLRVRRRRVRQDRGRDPCRVQGDPGRQAGRRARADHPARDPARQHVRRPVRRLSRSASRCSPGSSPTAQAKKVIEGRRDGRGRLRHRHPPAARATTSSSRTSACSSSTRSSGSACSTRRR